jgi:hypothetical protein
MGNNGAFLLVHSVDVPNDAEATIVLHGPKGGVELTLARTEIRKLAALLCSLLADAEGVIVSYPINLYARYTIEPPFDVAL